jgi:hypothetical protein
VFLSAPSSGECTVLLAWHIEKGKFEETSLDGFNVALAVHAPGDMTQGKWNVALYIDERANEGQRQALTQIFGGQAGGEPAALAPLIGKVLGVTPVRIDYEAKGRRRSLHIPKIAEMEIEALDGQGGREVTLENVPLTAVPNQTTVVAKSKRLTFHDHGENWDVSNKNGFYSPFSFRGA